MALVALKKLTTLQAGRETEMKNIGIRLASREKAELNKNILHARLQAVREIWAEVRTINSEIIIRDDANNDPYIQENWFDRIQGTYETTIDGILTLLAEFEKQSNVATPSGTYSEQSVAKLPRIQLPTFSGKYEDWASFSDLFTTLVHDVPGLSDATKLQYLKLSLVGKAAELVKDVETTNANYASTWQALSARYRNPRFIINKYLTNLISLPYLKRESASELRAFVDEAQRIVRALSNLSLPVEHWDVWLVFVLSEHLDQETRKLWESELSTKEQINEASNNAEITPLSNSLPTFAGLIRFLEKRSHALSMIAPVRDAAKRVSTAPLPAPHPRKVFHARSSKRSETSSCPLCSSMHPLARCFKLKNKNPHERLSAVRRLQACFNCLGSHHLHTCTSAARCTICQKKHHTMLHLGTQKEAQASPSGDQGSNGTAPRSNIPSVNIHMANLIAPNRRIILATARVLIKSLNGENTCARALLDQGSECSFVSESIVQLLGLPKHRTYVPLSGVGAGAAGAARLKTQIILASTVDPNFEMPIDMLVLPRLTSRIPTDDSYFDLKLLGGLTLADPHFCSSNKIDVILGADVYGQLLLSGIKRFSFSNLVAQNTTLGWIVSGALQTGTSRRAVGPSSESPRQVLHCSSDEKLEILLQRFWTLEDLPAPPSTLRPEDEICEKLFLDSHTRNSQGRYEVRLPLKSKPPFVAAESRQMALSSLSSMHRRFSRDAKLAQSYRDFMRDYERLGHMEKIPSTEIQQKEAWYLPHHAVVHESADFWKLRVVFDASRRIRGGCCLNDFLLSGTPLQNDLALVLLNWQKYRYVFTADIVKMFRQILVNNEDRNYQRIVWAPTPNVKPMDYRLKTVTYGTTCAPFLAIRTLLQLADDEGRKFPLGAECLKSETYVDDTFAGADELETAVQKRIQLSEILNSAGIELDKWAANHADLLPSKSRQPFTKRIEADRSVKTLGIQWNPVQDQFRFDATDIFDFATASTKRSVLSNIARLFDPLGWLSPITVTAKILMQDLWIRKCDWDSPLPVEFRERWHSYCHSLSHLSSLGINRWLGVTSTRSYQLHAFSDASSRAYAAVVYLRINEGDNKFSVSLISARTKTAPIKTVSIPNLELCGAALLVKLMCHIRKLKFFAEIPIFAWSDSQIVLTWLRKHPCSWKTFVANRVSFIQTELPSATWGHVPTRDNPADLATRGIDASALSRTELWWHGPHWLSFEQKEWPRPAEVQRSLHMQRLPSGPELLTRFSSLSRLMRVIAYCRRPLLNMRRRKLGREEFRSFLRSSELAEARVVVIRLAQTSDFSDEIEALKNGKTLPQRGRLSKLNPFLDQDEILRVGGRLAHSNLTFHIKHPPILTQQSALSRLFVRYAHRQCLHGGPTLTSSVLMQQVWILGRKGLVRSIIHKCVVCQRIKPSSAQQLMGDLPVDRVNIGRPFAVTGLDYAGPVQIRASRVRGHRSFKGYIAVFICFAVKAIHLELVSDLSTPSFISAFRRFVGRRGLCRKLVSDNATNFHGADHELKAMFQRASEFYKRTASLLANDGTEWEFIPPNAPHYGGLWEAGVKSVKHHLKRVVGEHTLTFEELSTVLVEIEACLNSRPLGALNSDTDDLQALTPFHFLTGTSSALLPDADYQNVPLNRLDRFQLLQRLRNQFWKRWSSEYLLHLQQREKWRGPSENFCVGRLVLVKDDRYPPSKWPVGRIVEVHPGADGNVRVATIKTASSLLRRHIHRLCPLHLDDRHEKA